MKTTKILAIVMLATTLAACTENLTDNTTEGMEQGIEFLPEISNDLAVTRALAVQETYTVTPLTTNDGETLYLHCTTEPRVQATTRGTLINDVTNDLTALGNFGVSGYRYAPSTQTVNDVTANFFFNAKVEEHAGTWKTSEPYYIPAAADRLAFYAYSPYSASFGSTEVTALTGNGTANADYGPMVLTYTVNPTMGSQADLMVANNEATFSTSKKVALDFHHALTALKFVLGNDVSPNWNIEWLSIGSVISTAKYKVGTGWMYDSSTTRSSFTLNFTSTQKPNGKPLSDEDKQLMGENEFYLMIPQAFTADDDDQCLTIMLKNPTTNKEKELTFPLKGTTWTAGTIVSYAITTSSVNVVQPTITYPADWGGETFTLQDAYGNGTEVGVYAVDISTKKVVTKNMKLTYNLTAGTWSTSGDDVLKYNRNYDYYFYYPYKANISGGHVLDDTFSGSSATDFFSGVISNWTVSDDQSTSTKLLACDLHIGQAVHDADNFTQVNVAMQHAMGLAKITLETKSFTAASITYKPASTSSGNEFVRENQPIYIRATDELASPSFSSYLYLQNHEIYYYITKGNRNIQFGGITGVHNEWKNNITATISNGACSAHTATPKDPPANACYEGVFFTCISDVQSYDIEEKGFYQLEVYGAKGASNWGGNGGYATGQAFLNTGTIYVCVGAQGQDFYDTNNGNTRLGGAGGYNGGGNGGNTAANNSQENSAHGGGGGGGATHIATTNYGELKNYKEHRDDVLIVAGGGGGCCKHDASNVWYPGGVGGGAAGGNSSKPSSNNDSKCPISYGAGVDASHPGYDFGQGQNGRYGTINGWGSWGGGGGGGGWMGGYSSQASGYITDAAGGGGCGYIQESLFLTGSYSMSSGVRTGNGYAIITSPVPVQ